MSALPASPGPTGRVLPQSIEAEESVLGAMLIDKEAISRAMSILKSQDFYRDAHRHVFSAIVNVFDQRGSVDLVTVGEELRSRGSLEAVGGIGYVAGLAHGVPTAANVEHYANIVREKAMLRSLINTATEIGSRAYDPGEDPAKLLDDAERMVFEVAGRQGRRSFYSLKEVLSTTLDRLNAAHLKKTELVGIPTGLGDFDLMTSGLQRSDLIIIAARPSMGKTTLLLQLALSAAKAGVPVAIFSLEMAREQLGVRILCAEGGIDALRARDGKLDDQDWVNVSAAVQRLSEAPIYIDDSSNLSVMDLRTKARLIQSEVGLGLLIVDYMQLMYSRGRFENRQQEISEISRLLKGLARELKIPVVVASQMSRAVERREDRRPMLSDLRESGSIEQDADVVCFIHHDPKQENQNMCELIIAKQRMGPTGAIEAFFQKEIGRFRAIAKIDE